LVIKQINRIKFIKNFRFSQKGTSYISALGFSWISDGRLGRAKTIIIGFTIYSLGYIFIILLSDEPTHEKLCPIHNTTNSSNLSASGFIDQFCIQYILPALILTASGVGAVQANMTVFGAEQVREQKNKTRYFDIYYAVINIGGLIAFGGIAYLQLNARNGYFVGYLISGILLILAFVLFVIGYKFYVHLKPHDSVITHFFPVVINAFQSWRYYHRNRR
jgi:dipeptide/tripeptide permease